MKAPAEKTAGFTLIEVLLVILILAVLVALLYPSLATLTAEGRNTKCLANLRQVNLAFNQYIADNDGSFFKAREWNNLLDPYIQRQGGWYSAATFKEALVTCPEINSRSPRQYNSGIYGVNYSFINTIEGGNGVPPTWPLKVVNVSSPSKAWSFTEASRCDASGGYNITPIGFVTPGSLIPKHGVSQALAWVHPGGRKNFAFLDGHVSSMTWAEVNVFNGASSRSKEYTEFHGLREQ
jgi:general secretion pathway protein G